MQLQDIVLRKLHPHGGGVPRKVAGESLCGGAETIPGRYRVTMMGRLSRASLKEGWIRDETGPLLRCERGCRRL